MEPMPMTKRLMHQRFLTPVHAGVLRHRESGAYDVQPAGGVAALTKKPLSMMRPAENVVQNDSMFEEGKGHVARADHERMQKLPKAPARIGMITKKIMMVAWHRERHVVGGRLEDAGPVSLRNTLMPRNRRLRPGELPADDEGEEAAQDHHERGHEEELRAIILWSVEKMYVRTKRRRGARARCARSRRERSFLRFPSVLVGGFAASADFAGSGLRLRRRRGGAEVPGAHFL